MSKIDRYLLQALRADQAAPEVETEAMMPLEAESVPGFREPGGIPLLIRTVDASWTGSQIPDLTVLSRLGSIVSGRGSAASLRALDEDEDVVSVEASRPLEGPGELAVSLPLVHAVQVHSVLGERGDEAIFALVDGGLDVLHEAFQDSQGKTRILALWDQSDASGTPRPHPFGYGTLHLQADIDGYIQGGQAPAGLDRDSNGHGTHVASIGAGRAAGVFAGGMAPEARIVAVIPARRSDPGDPASIGYSHNHVDALAWIRQVARAAGLPVAVNMSLGMNAGAHDGTSLLEVAFDEFSSGGRAPGLVAVKSAGNEGGQSGHALLTVQTGNTTDIQWRSLNSTRRQDVIELWYHSSNDLEFELEDPNGKRTPTLSRTNQEVSGVFSSGDHFELDLDRLHYDNGDSRVLVRIHRGGAPAVFAKGLWKLHVTCIQTHGRGRIHAWIERNNSRPINFLNHQSDEVSLSIPGTARTAITVASVPPATPQAPAASSSRGRTRDEREKPDIAAPGVGITAARAGTATGVVSNSGTSMAAPHVTGALVLLLSHWSKRKSQVPDWRQLSAAQMRAALINTSSGFNGRHDIGIGFGLLDAQALIDSFS